jgi:diguanylate cyclase (GGDEF)-like protein/PAS domain S-box-containing protein
MLFKIFILTCIVLIANTYAIQTVKIAVLDYKSKAETIQEWASTAAYLTKKLPQYNFEIIAMNYPEINNAVKDESVDFVVTNSGHYVYLESKNHLSRIATMITYRQGQWLDSFGGVIVTRSNNDSIKTIKDLEGKKIAAVNSESLGSYAAQMYELKNNNIHANDITIDFTGTPSSNTVKRVLEGKDDAGFVRTEVLEDMVHKGILDIKKIKIINGQKVENFPFLLSTNLYPQWPIARMPKTSYALTNKVIVALLSINTDPNMNGIKVAWTAPLDYSNIHKIFQALKLPPYDKVEHFTPRDIYSKYKLFFISVIITIFLIIGGRLREFYLRKKLESSNQKLKYESRKNEMMLRLSGDGIHILDMRGNIIQVSDMFCMMIGYSRDELLGMNLTLFEKEIPLHELLLQWQELTSQSQTLQTKHVRKDKTSYDAQINFAKITIEEENYIYCSARDITKQLLEEAQTRLAATVYETSSDAIIISDGDTNIISVNPAFLKFTGYSIAEIVNQPLHILYSGQQDANFYNSLWNAINSTGKWEGSIVDRKKDGSLFTKWLDVITIFDGDGNPYRRVSKFSDITDEKEVQKQIWYQANFDKLTDLPNRSMFMFRLEKRLQELKPESQKMALMYIDLDNFKEVNESLGHDKGDLLLQEAAFRIKKCTQSTNEVASRIGGDEFTIIYLHVEKLEDLEISAQCLLKELARPFIIDEKQIFVTASIGITIAPEDGLHADTLLKNADQAMYAAKNDGKNKYRYFTAIMQEKVTKRMQLIHEMRKAIDLKQFVLYYQPITELATGVINKAEALIRWKKEDGEMVSPADFIPLAEETGLILEIGEWVINEACAQVKIWREKYNPDFQVSINKSPMQFKSEKYASSLVLDAIERLSIPASSVVVEITEGLLMEQTGLVHQKLKSLEAHGVQLSLDDFGTGYSSLSYLKKFNIDFLKIDQSFVRNLETDENDRILCEAMVAMAHKLRIKVISEGVETMAQREYLNSIGCDFIQGYLVSRPIEATEFEKRFFL